MLVEGSSGARIARCHATIGTAQAAAAWPSRTMPRTASVTITATSAVQRRPKAAVTAWERRRHGADRDRRRHRADATLQVCRSTVPNDRCQGFPANRGRIPPRTCRMPMKTRDRELLVIQDFRRRTVMSGGVKEWMHATAINVDVGHGCLPITSFQRDVASCVMSGGTTCVAARVFVLVSNDVARDHSGKA